MTFKEYLIKKSVPFREVDGGYFVKDEDLFAYEKEVRELFPKFKFISEYIRYEGVPKSVTDAHKP